MVPYRCSIEGDQFGTFLVTNRGIQIWLFLRPHVGSDSVFEALLPCRSDPSGPPVAIDVALWESNYYRFGGSSRECGRVQLRQVYLSYHDTPHCNSTFEIDDSAIHNEGFTSSTTYPEGLITGDTVTLRTTNPLCVKRYSCGQEYGFTVGFGQCFGQNWIHVVCEEPDTISWKAYDLMLSRAPEHAQSMKKARSGAAGCQVYIWQTCLPRSSWILHTSCVMWKSSRTCGIKLEVFREPGLSNVSGEWTGFDVDVSSFFSCTFPSHWSLYTGNRRCRP